VRDFRVEALAQDEFEDAAIWYENQRPALGLEFIAEVDRVLQRIAHQDAFSTAPIDRVPGGVVRRELWNDSHTWCSSSSPRMREG